MKKQLEDLIQQVYHKEKRNLFTFLTGARISSDSGIPTYCGEDVIWVKGTQFHKLEEFRTLKYFKEHPEEVLQYSLFRKKIFENALGHKKKSHTKLYETFNKNWRRPTLPLSQYHRRWWA